MSTNPVVFRDGFCLAKLIDQPGPMPYSTLERICAHLTTASKNEVRFDWHPIGGIPFLLYLGDYEQARKTFLEAAPFIRGEAEAYYHQWCRENDFCFYNPAFKSTLASPESVEAPKSKTIGQVMNAGK